MAKRICEEDMETLKKRFHYTNIDGIPKFEKTILGYKTNDEYGHSYYELDMEQFPKTCTIKYVTDCIEAEEPNLGIIKKMNWQQLNDDYFTVADIETTGFSPEKGGRIIEIGAVKINKDGNIVDRFSEFINPGMKISAKITEITSITNEMVADADYVGKVMSRFWDFIRGTTMVFHNASFDWDRFLLFNFSQIGLTLPPTYPCIDTLLLDKELFPNEKKHTLDQMCERLNVVVENHHRAIFDAEMTAKAFVKLREMSKGKWENMPHTTWNLSKKSFEIKIKNVRFWGKFKKDGTMTVGRQYVHFTCNGYSGNAYYDIMEDCWYMKNCKISFKAEMLESKVLEFLNLSMDELRERRIA